jgi:hypothetical protein
MYGGGREEREKRWTVRRKWVEAEKRKEIRGKAALHVCPFIWLVLM